MVTGEEYSNPQGEGGLDDPACGCLLCRKRGERMGPTLPSPRQTAIGSCRVNLLSESYLDVLTYPTDGEGSRENKGR